MNRHTGAAISRREHIRQSIGDIVTTRIGSRVQRREYGCLLVDLLDQPGNAATLLRCYAAIAMALMRWEPRVRVDRVQLTQLSQAGQYVLELEITDRESLDAGSLSVPLNLGAVA